MNKLASVFVVAATLALALPTMAQRPRTSPHDTVSANVDGDGTRVTVVYGRPYTKDPKSGEPRKIWGGLVPYGKVWRMGADEATLLITQQPITLGDLKVPAGAYTLWMLPKEDGTAQLLVNKQIGQWGVGRDMKKIYDESKDLGRVDLKKTTLDKAVDQFTVSVGKGESGGAELKLSWENTQYSAPITVQK